MHLIRILTMCLGVAALAYSSTTLLAQEDPRDQEPEEPSDPWLPEEPIPTADPTPPELEPATENPANAPRICAANSSYAPRGGCTEYNPRYALWSDGALKNRYVFFPTTGDPALHTTDPNRWGFPVGTRFYKNFSSKSGALLESRVITKVREGDDWASWDVKSYAWSGNQSEPKLVLHNSRALLNDSGKTINVKTDYTNMNGTEHDIPSIGECRQCHQRQRYDAVLGFNALQLNGSDYPLDRLVTERRLAAEPQNAEVPSTDETTREAMGYLHGNCSNCHAPGGTAALFNDLDLRVLLDTPLNSQPVMQTGVCRCLTEPYAVPAGGLHEKAASVTARVDRGHPENSLLLARMSYRGAFPDQPATPARSPQMPNIASKRADAEHVPVIRKWIKELGQSGDPCKCTPTPTEE